MSYKKFGYQGDVSQVLEQAPSDFRVSWEYGLFLLETPGIAKPSDIFLYVPEKEMEMWTTHLKQYGAYETRVLPTIRLFGMSSLPQPSKKHPHVVNEQRLLEDILRSMPARFAENNPEVLAQLKRKEVA
ncbi:hypothetical protein HYS48_04940 [Candidatus Woesearchaeota archaeon]|nr:hypothetical protein [Candidatus Woesearchaeota archaeon]